MNLKEKLSQDLKEAMKAKDEAKVRTVRMLLAAIKNFEVEKMKSATDEDILQIMAKEIKKRKESIELYLKGGREDLAKAEEEEIKIIESYMPQQMSEEEIREFAKKIIEELKLSGPKDVGTAMKAIMSQLKGKADGKLVNKIVTELLSGSN
ncbi:GatB/YqeY domain-containing protein [Pseudothermotoga thermarum]|uniref:GatB/YqeY domain-containing protein n=1 Tax=Pseudothermotoga thermarum DSM 5069 TaxID=688269 RepID=F7YWI6_9THEM|nr:GatB/YqeY domain-containing protein [Pseudothermotoga thermarum]AEH51967.1 GatB/YqeY domain-containing protein [Pseudothermotoga thermarum DSM 5069]